MSELNFDFLNSLQTPDEWIENALAIPHKSKKSALRRLRPYFIGTAAALIIVSAVVLTLLLNTNGKAPLNKSPEFPVQIPDATVPVDSTGEYSIPQGDPLTTEDSYPADISGDPCAQAPPNENGALPSVTEGAQPHAQPSGQTNPTEGARQTDVTKPTEGTKPTEKAEPTQPASINQIEATEPVTTLPIVEDDTLPQEPTDPIEPDTTQPASAPRAFDGSFTLRIFESSEMFSSQYVSVDFFDAAGVSCGNTVVLQPRLSKAGYMAATFHPLESGVALYRWKPCTMRVYDASGHITDSYVTVHSGSGIVVSV